MEPHLPDATPQMSYAGFDRYIEHHRWQELPTHQIIDLYEVVWLKTRYPHFFRIVNPTDLIEFILDASPYASIINYILNELDIVDLSMRYKRPLMTPLGSHMALQQIPQDDRQRVIEDTIDALYKRLNAVLHGDEEYYVFYDWLDDTSIVLVRYDVNVPKENTRGHS